MKIIAFSKSLFLETIVSHLYTLLYSIIILFYLTQIFLISDGVFYNPDELEYIYCAQRLIQNDFRFESFDAHTVGPFSIYLIAIYFKISNSLSIETLHVFKELIKMLTALLLVYYNRSDKVAGITSALLFMCILSIPNPDVLSFNTEFFTLPILVYLYFKRNSTNIISTSFFVFCLPLLKLQFVLFSLYFFTYQIYFFYRRGLFLTLSKILLFVYPSFCVIFFVFFLKCDLDLFYFNYIEKNQWYVSNFSSNSSFRALMLMFANHFFQFFIFLIFVFWFTFWGISKPLKLIQFEILLVVLAFISILIPKTGFSHYYIIAVSPLIFLLIKLIQKPRVSSLSVIFMWVLLFCFTFYGQMTSKNLKFIYCVSHPLDKIEICQTKPNSNIELVLDSLLCDFFSKERRPTLFLSGRYDVQGFYYKYKNCVTLVSRSNYSSYLSKLKGKMFEKEYNQLMHDFYVHDNPDIVILMPEHDFYSVEFDLLLNSKYRLIYHRENMSIYVKSVDSGQVYRNCKDLQL